MQTTQTLNPPAPHLTEPVAAAQSAVSWGAVFAGAVIAAALSALLIMGGTGLGFLAVSPWRGEGASGVAIVASTIAWLFVVQIIAYGAAGYVTGRLRTRWTDTATDEIYFRDTAHGLLVWAVSALIGLALLGSAASSAVTGAANAGASLAGSGAGAAAAAASQSADSLSVEQALERLNEAIQRSAPLTESDRLAAAQTEQTLREAADDARKAAAAFSLWAFAALLTGAFVASFAATVGGRARDD